MLSNFMPQNASFPPKGYSSFLNKRPKNRIIAVRHLLWGNLEVVFAGGSVNSLPDVGWTGGKKDTDAFHLL